jgi:hypothetical protein
MVGGVEFDPARSQERFRAALTDHASTILLPSLVARVRSAATHVKMEVSAWRSQAYEDVEAGRVDTALSAEEGPPALESEAVFSIRRKNKKSIPEQERNATTGSENRTLPVLPSGTIRMRSP